MLTKMMKQHALGTVVLLLAIAFGYVCGQANELVKIFQDCHRLSPEFDGCIKNAFNQLQPYFKTGIPELNIAPFDPHRITFVEQRRGLANGLGGYHLVLTDVEEFKWANSKVTKYKTDWENDRIIYSQYFGNKYLHGNYDFKLSVAGQTMHTKGMWNITLIGYSQTTSVTRVNGPGSLLKVRIEIDELQDMILKITNAFNGRQVIENTADFIINAMWKAGFPFAKPLIHDLISSAFTDIFNESFRYFPLEDFIKD